MDLLNVLDQWLDKTVRPLLMGEMFIVRYADDFIIGFEYKEDAQRVNQTLPKRMQKYGLTIHPGKSQLHLLYTKTLPSQNNHPTWQRTTSIKVNTLIQ